MTEIPAVPTPTQPTNRSSRDTTIIGILLFLLITTIGITTWLAKPLLFPKSQPVTLPTRDEQLFADNTIEPTPLPRPTDIPLQGPGKHVCDFLGFCNYYENPDRVGCPVTYADPKCQSQCGDMSKRCRSPEAK